MSKCGFSVVSGLLGTLDMLIIPEGVLPNNIRQLPLWLSCDSVPLIA